jgi:hypothetical protein
VDDGQLWFRYAFLPRRAINDPIDDLNIMLILCYLSSKVMNLLSKIIFIFIVVFDGGEHVGDAFFEFSFELELAGLSLCDLSLKLMNSIYFRDFRDVLSRSITINKFIAVGGGLLFGGEGRLC